MSVLTHSTLTLKTSGFFVKCKFRVCYLVSEFQGQWALILVNTYLNLTCQYLELGFQDHIFIAASFSMLYIEMVWFRTFVDSWRSILHFHLAYNSLHHYMGCPLSIDVGDCQFGLVKIMTPLGIRNNYPCYHSLHNQEKINTTPTRDYLVVICN